MSKKAVANATRSKALYNIDSFNHYDFERLTWTLVLA
jgi:hypothetical protein